MLHPSDLSAPQARVVRALAAGKPVMNVRNKWFIRGELSPLSDRTVAVVIGMGLAATVPGRAEIIATEATSEMSRRLAERVRVGIG